MQMAEVVATALIIEPIFQQCRNVANLLLRPVQIEAAKYRQTRRAETVTGPFPVSRRFLPTLEETLWHNFL